jgi:nucleobase:cation symporter-1, NCS1 family
MSSQRSEVSQGIREAHVPFVLEHRGIEYIPPDQRAGNPIQLGWMWLATVANIGPVVFGGLLPLLGLSFMQSVAILIIGNLSWALVGIGSLTGPDAGTTTYMVSRAPFGQNGNRVVSFFNWLTLLGYEATFLILIVQAELALAHKVGGGHQGAGLKVLLILIAAAILPIIAIYGHATVVKVLAVLSAPFVALYILFAILVIPKTNLSHLSHGASWPVVFVGLSIVLSVSGIGFVNQSADYSRYLPRSTNRWHLALATSLGGFVSLTGLMILGAAIASRLTNGIDVVSGIPSLFAGYYAVPYLVIIAIQLLLADAFALYSSGVTLQAIGVKVQRWQAVLIDTVICAVVTAIAIFSNRFNTLLSDFLLFALVFASPWVTIYLMDWFFRRGRYDVASLQKERGGIYWRNGGVNVRALVSLGLGMAAVLMWINTSVYEGPLASRTGGTDLSWLFGAVVSGILYFVLGRPVVRAEQIEMIKGTGDVTVHKVEPDAKPAVS